MTNAVVNLWSLMVGVEGKSVSQSENATEVVKLASAKAGFGTELDLEVTEHGTWKIRMGEQRLCELLPIIDSKSKVCSSSEISTSYHSNKKWKW